MTRPASFVLAVLAACCTLGAPAAPAQQTAPPAGQTQMPPADVLCWALGTNLGIAAVVHEAGTAPKIVTDRLETCKTIAGVLGAELPPLPERAGEDKAAFGAKIIHFAVKEIQPLAKQLKEKHGPRQARLFEIGIKSSLLAFMYAPGDSTGLAIADLIEDRAKKCELPPTLCEPLIIAVRTKRPYDDVKSKLFAMHDVVRKHLLAGK